MTSVYDIRYRTRQNIIALPLGPKTDSDELDSTCELSRQARLGLTEASALAVLFVQFEGVMFISLTFDVEMKIESWLFIRAKSGMIFVLGNVESKMKSRELGANFGARFGGSEAGVLALVFKGFMNLREDVVRW
jgi:hypothetical protein